jgi:hypothetical protein
MDFSLWQLALIRDALRAYKCYGADVGDRAFTWASIAEGILEATNVAVPPERLRQFVEGVSVRGGQRKHPVPAPDRMAAIVRFVTDEDLGLLADDELAEQVPAHHAPLRLLDYLDEREGQRLLPTGQMNGAYRAARRDERAFVVREMTLQRPSEKGLIQVIETEDYYDAAAAGAFEAWSAQDRLEGRRSCVRHAGWAVLTPEDNLLFFLKNPRNGRNRYYLSLGADAALWSDRPLTFIALLHHDFPLELEEGDTDGVAVADKIAAEITKNVMVFERKGEV